MIYASLRWSRLSLAPALYTFEHLIRLIVSGQALSEDAAAVMPNRVHIALSARFGALRPPAVILSSRVTYVAFMDSTSSWQPDYLSRAGYYKTRE